MKCPYCGKPLTLTKAATTTPTDPEAADHAKDTIDDALSVDAELLHVSMSEGKVLYALKEYLPGEDGRQTWRRIDNIIKLHGGKWISCGSESHWEVPT